MRDPRSRLKIALAVYAVLTVLALVTLTAEVRVFVLVLNAALAFKCWLALKREERP